MKKRNKVSCATERFIRYIDSILLEKEFKNNNTDMKQYIDFIHEECISAGMEVDKEFIRNHYINKKYFVNKSGGR